MKKKVWFVGGETGGHVVPLLAVAEQLKETQKVAVKFVGSRHSIESRLAKKHGYPFIVVWSGKFRRSWSFLVALRNGLDFLLLAFGICQAWWLLGKDRPTIVFSKGGPVALPVALAAWIRKIPLFTHESDSVMGQSNRLISRLATKVYVGFPAEMYPFVPAQKLVHVGIPLRQEFCTTTTRRAEIPMVLVTGGSQGAASVGRIVLDVLPQIVSKAHVMHICGEALLKECEIAKDKLPPKLRDRYAYVAFTDEMAHYIAESTCVVTRGSSQLFEIAALGRAIISVPLPWAANNHQVKNSHYFASRGAAIVVRQENLTPTLLYETIDSVLSDPVLRRKMEHAGRQLVRCDAAKRIAQDLSSYTE